MDINWSEELAKAREEIGIPSWDQIWQENLNSWNNFLSFVRSVDWSEGWLLGLFGFHIVIFIIVILTRKRFNVQATLWLGTCTHDLLYSF